MQKYGDVVILNVCEESRKVYGAVPARDPSDATLCQDDTRGLGKLQYYSLIFYPEAQCIFNGTPLKFGKAGGWQNKWVCFSSSGASIWRWGGGFRFRRQSYEIKFCHSD